MRWTYSIQKGKTTFIQAKPLRAGSPLRRAMQRLMIHRTKSGVMKMPKSAKFTMSYVSSCASVGILATE